MTAKKWNQETAKPSQPEAERFLVDHPWFIEGGLANVS